MFTRLPMIALSLGSMLMAASCESTFDYYPNHEPPVACDEVHKGTNPGDFGGTTNKFTSSTAGTNPSTGPAASEPTTTPMMSIGR